jgi:hypothetical protein
MRTIFPIFSVVCGVVFDAFAVQQREQSLASLIAHVGSPLSGEAILVLHGRAPERAHLDEVWTEWQKRFPDLDANHNSLAGIIFVQSPEPDQSWVTVAGAVLDAAALAVSTLDPPGNTAAELVWKPAVTPCSRFSRVRVRCSQSDGRLTKMASS